MTSQQRVDFRRFRGYVDGLAKLGLTVEVIETALREGLEEWSRAPDGIPRSLQGQLPSGYAIASASRAIGAAGVEQAEGTAWEPNDWELRTLERDGALAYRVRFWRGCSRTGLEGPEPRTARSRGGGTQALVSSQTELLSRDVVELRPKSVDNRLFLVVLFRFEEQDGRCIVHYEVSAPIDYDEDSQHVTGWADRQALGRFEFDLGDGSGPSGYEQEGYDHDPDLDRD